MQVILVRHGQTDWNREGIFRGRIDVKLLNDTNHIKSVDQIIENNRSPENPLG